MIASPLTLSARLVSGESGKEVISSEVGAVRFDYSAARKPAGLEMIQKGDPIKWDIPVMSRPEIAVAVKAGRDLDERTAQMTAAINDIAGVPQRCDSVAD
jgi:hypothetical protein